MTVYEPVCPQPDGDMPDDWPVEWWEAFQALHAGQSRAEVGDLVGKSKSTISRWVRLWRDIYGSDVVPPRAPGFPPGAASEGRLLGAEANAVKYAAVREGQAFEAGESASAVRELIDSQLAAMAADTELRLSPREILDLTRAYDLLSRRADALADIPKPGETTGEDHEGFDSGIDISHLEPGGDEEMEVALSAAEDVVRQFRIVRDGDEIKETPRSTKPLVAGGHHPATGQ